MYGTSLQASSGVRLKVDQVTLNSPVVDGGVVGVFTTVNLARTYTNPVVFVLPTDQNPDPSTVRIRNVTPNSFEMAVIEAPQNFGGSLGVSAMDISYLVLEAGTYNLGGVTMEVGVGGTSPTNAILNTVTQQGRNASGTVNWVNLNFTSSFAAEPTVLLQVQSDNNETLNPVLTSTPYLETIARNVTASTMQFALERAETSGGVTNAENVGYLAIASNTSGSFSAGASTINFQTFRTSDSITGNCTNFTYNSGSLGTTPIVLASQNTRDGGDGGWVQRCNLASTTQIGLEIDEDLAADTDRAHTDERAGMLLFSGAFNTTIGGLPFEAGRVTTPTQIVVGGITLSFASVNFSNPFASDNILIFPMPSSEGVGPASLRVKSVDRNGFEIAQVEPTGEPGAHERMTIDYIAVEAGTHNLANNVVLEAGSINTAQTIAGTGPAGGFTTLNFSHTFSAAPVLLTQVQSINSEGSLDPSNVSVPWLTTATASVGTSSAQIALERAEAIAGTVVSETIGYLAITPSVQESLLDDSGNTINYQSLITPNNIQGPDNGDGCFENNFATSFASGNVRAVASSRVRNGVNGFWFRRCALDNTQIGLYADEDRANDTERSHTNEIASVLAFDNNFESCLEASLEVIKLVSTVQDPINIATNPKAINGAELQYQVTITNSRAGSTVPNTVTIEDDLPTGVELFVGDGVVSPFTIVNNTDSGSGNTLTFTPFGGFASATDSYQFSNNNGVDFNYTPVDPDGDQYDPVITHFRVVPTGNMTAADATYTPEVQISYRVRIN